MFSKENLPLFYCKLQNRDQNANLQYQYQSFVASEEAFYIFFKIKIQNVAFFFFLMI